MNLSQKLFLAAAFSVAIAISSASACSIKINDKAQKNLLVAEAASHLDIALSDVKETFVASYAKSFSGGSGSSCPETLQTSAEISFKYSPYPGQDCQAEVRIERSMSFESGESFADFSELSAACSISQRKLIKLGLPKRP